MPTELVDIAPRAPLRSEGPSLHGREITRHRARRDGCDGKRAESVGEQVRLDHVGGKAAQHAVSGQSKRASLSARGVVPADELAGFVLCRQEERNESRARGWSERGKRCLGARCLRCPSDARCERQAERDGANVRQKDHAKTSMCTPCARWQAHHRRGWHMIVKPWFHCCENSRSRASRAIATDSALTT